jgi:hypothetical protein
LTSGLLLLESVVDENTLSTKRRPLSLTAELFDGGVVGAKKAEF